MIGGFYLYSNIVELINQFHFTIYYSDGFEIITSWFPRFIFNKNISLSLLARGAVENGVSATEVRNDIITDARRLIDKVPANVYTMRDILKAYIESH